MLPLLFVYSKQAANYLAAFYDTSTYQANGTYPELKRMSRFV